MDAHEGMRPMPLANGLKRVGLVVLLCLSALRAGMADEPASPVDPYDPAYLSAPFVDGVFYDGGVTLPLPPRYRDGRALLMAGHFTSRRYEYCRNKHFEDSKWTCGPDDMPAAGSWPYKVIYEHPYFIIFVGKYDYPEKTQTMAHIISFSVYGYPPRAEYFYTFGSAYIGTGAVFDLPDREIVRLLTEGRDMPQMVDGYLKESSFGLSGEEAWDRDTAGEDAMLAPLSCRQDMDIPCFRAGCDRFPDLCGYAWEMKEKLDLDFEDRNSILRQLGKHGTK